MDNTIYSTRYQNTAENLKSQENLGQKNRSADKEKTSSRSADYQDHVQINTSSRDLQAAPTSEIQQEHEITSEARASEMLKTVSQSILKNGGSAVSSQANSTHAAAMSLLAE